MRGRYLLRRPDRDRRGVVTLAAAVAAAVALGGCSTGWDDAPWAHRLPPADEINEVRAVENCEELVVASRPALRDAVESMWPEADQGPFGLFGGGDEDSPSSDGEAVPADAAGDAEAIRRAPADGAAAGSPGVVGTNLQERDVDEADLVKTDGTRIVSIVGASLRVTVLDASPAIDGRLDLGDVGATELFLRGGTALVLGTGVRDRRSANEPGPAGPTTTLTSVSLTDPAAPAVTSSVEVDGSLVTAREVDGLARVVVQQTPAAFEELATAGSREAALAVVDDLDADDLLPRIERDGDSGALGRCEDVLVAGAAAAPATRSGDAADRADRAAAIDVAGPGRPAGGAGTVTVLSVGDDLGSLESVSLQGTAETVYASSDALYVASSGWDQAGSRTDVHRLALDGDGPATYTGSGRAPGHLVDQFALSDRAGTLRLVTTLDRTDGGQSSARLTVLDTDGTLDEIAHVGGMGIGERVHSVRFLADLAYLVTFRQVDPLYAVDLGDPRAPRLLGELKVPGFSEYLHPLGEGLLLGVGREVDPASGVDRGLKVSLFDVTDPSAMVERDQIVVGDAWSPASGDHRAFTWDPVRRRAILPVERACVGGGPVPVPIPDRGPVPGPDRRVATSVAPCTPAGASMVIEVADGALGTVAEIGHAAPWDGATTTAPLRSVIVDDDLWTVSLVGLGRSDAGTPIGVELLRF